MAEQVVPPAPWSSEVQTVQTWAPKVVFFWSKLTSCIKLASAKSIRKHTFTHTQGTCGWRLSSLGQSYQAVGPRLAVLRRGVQVRAVPELAPEVITSAQLLSLAGFIALWPKDPEDVRRTLSDHCPAWNWDAFPHQGAFIAVAQTQGCVAGQLNGTDIERGPRYMNLHDPALCQSREFTL